MRRAITIEGIVQGVGFRPFVYSLASRLQLGGFVRNHSGRVDIEAEGPDSRLDQFLAALSANPPPLARIERITWQSTESKGEQTFDIQSSEEKSDSPNRSIFIPADIATCDQCIAELFDPANRRYLYPFINCTNCGPRLTIIDSAPYDRSRTTMAAFEMCPECRAEYETPADRRFHAQPTCCPHCGPQLQILAPGGTPIDAQDPLDYLADALGAGKIAAIKGLGGFHLAVDARNEHAVAELRRRKHRQEKPLAVMVRDLSLANLLCDAGPAEAELLQSARRPIVLLKKRDGIARHLAASVAPGTPWLGVMLPYTPLHERLLRAMDGIPLVMTSGNQSDEPIAYENNDAVARLSNIADVFLVHNRAIHTRCDDSVTRIVDGIELPIRRSRGDAPQPIHLPVFCPIPTLAVGGQLKSTFALARDNLAFLGHHLGDLDDLAARQAFERDVVIYEQLFQIRPKQIAHDLHPDYASTHYARRRAAQEGIDLLPVQHHHAHMASCMADNALTRRVIGVTFDGTGLGADGAIWGGEFLVGDYHDFIRAAHLRYVPLPGGEAAVRQPWRMALSHLLDAECSDDTLAGRIEKNSRRAVAQMIEKQINAPQTSSAGRLFDAVASLAGLRDNVSYEAQAAVELEHLAAASDADGAYPFEIDSSAGMIIDTRPLIRAVAADVHAGADGATIARRFHSTIVNLIAIVCGRISQTTGIDTVVLSGGVFLNALLTTEVTTRLMREDFRVFRHQSVPPNDGGLSLGQLAIAAAARGEPDFILETKCALQSQEK